MKSLLISSMYFPPQTGGISHYMGRLASTLGPSRVCCFTGAMARGDDHIGASEPRACRRPRVFRGSKYYQAMAWGHPRRPLDRTLLDGRGVRLCR